MTQWHVIHGDILDVRADGLICSANPNLNLSGGVGGAFLLKFGREMQDFLHGYLREKNLRHLEPGKAVVAPACGSPYTAVAHAVSVDAFYDTTIEQILATYTEAIRGLTDAGCRSIAAACLGCGYGRCPPEEFAKAVGRLMAIPFEDADEITLVTTNRDLATSVRTMMETGSG